MGIVEGLKDMNTAAEVLGLESSKDVAPLCDVVDEMRSAAAEKGPFASRHEALGVLLEEFDEFLDAIRADDHDNALEEARQIAAVMIRFYIQFRGQA